MTNLTTMTAEDAKDFRFSNSTAQNPTIFPSDIKLNIVSETQLGDFLSSRLTDVKTLIHFEAWLYNTAEELSDNYTGGQWQMAEISFTNPYTQREDAILFTATQAA